MYLDATISLNCHCCRHIDIIPIISRYTGITKCFSITALAIDLFIKQVNYTKNCIFQRMLSYEPNCRVSAKVALTDKYFEDVAVHKPKLY